MLHALSVLAANGVFTLTDRTEVRVRDPDPITNAAALDIDTRVDARAVVTLPSTVYTLAYLPQLSILDLNGAGTNPALMNGALLSGEWHSHRTRLALSELASYGDLTFESVQALPNPGSPSTPTPVGQPMPLPSTTLVPAAQSVRFASSRTTLDSTLDLRPWTIRLEVGYQLSGGVGAAAQETLAFQNGPLANASADYRLSSRDHLVTETMLSQFSFSTGADDYLGQVDEQWRHRWAPKTDTAIGFGAYAAHARPAFGEPYGDEVNPVANAEIDQGFAQGQNHELVRVAVTLAPLVNPLNGSVDERVSGILGATWTRRRLGVSLFGGASQSTDPNTAVAGRFLSAEVDATYRATEAVTFDVGARALYQLQNTAGTPASPNEPTPFVGQTFTQDVVFLAVTVRAVKARF